jgi:predicted metalloprotease
LDSPYGKELKSSFGRKWSDEAVSYVVNKEYGHLVGTVMRKVDKRKRKATYGSLDDYEVAWEYTSLG